LLSIDDDIYDSRPNPCNRLTKLSEFS